MQLLVKSLAKLAYPQRQECQMVRHPAVLEADARMLGNAASARVTGSVSRLHRVCCGRQTTSACNFANRTCIRLPSHVAAVCRKSPSGLQPSPS